MSIDLIHGDCLEVMPTLEAGSIDLILIDPPYNTSSLKWDIVIPFEEMWNCIKHVMKKDAAVCIFGIEPFSSKLRLSNLRMFKHDWIWHKRRHANFFQLNYHPRKTHEIISVFSFGKHNYYPIKVRGVDKKERIKFDSQNSKKYYTTHKKNTTSQVNIFVNPESIIEIRDNEKCKNKNTHPTQKPVNILEYLIRTYTKRGDTVLDFCMGSGSTGIACLNLGRNFIGIEKDNKYFQIAEARLALHENNLRHDKKLKLNVESDLKIDYGESLFD